MSCEVTRLFIMPVEAKHCIILSTLVLSVSQRCESYLVRPRHIYVNLLYIAHIVSADGVINGYPCMIAS